MRIAVLFPCFLAALLTAVPAGLRVARADPLNPTDNQPVLRDPSPSDSHPFAPGLATGGAADPGHALDVAPPASRAGCSPLNPCAIPPPIENHVEAPRPAPP